MGVQTAPRWGSAIPFEERRWFAWEKLLWNSYQHPALGVALLVVLVPLSIMALPLLPFFSLATLRPPPPPRGQYEVGSTDVNQLCTIDGSPRMLRLRVFYPARPPPKRRRLPWRSSHSWLAPDAARFRYATQHAYGLPLPKCLLRVLAPYLGWVLLWAKLPSRVRRGAAPAVSSATVATGAAGSDAGGWPLVLFSHGLYGCAAGYSGLCAEVCSHGSVVVALEHKGKRAMRSSAHTTTYDVMPV